jgi:hypothetical protein
MQSLNENGPADGDWFQVLSPAERVPDAIDLAVTALVSQAKAIQERSILIDTASMKVIQEASEAHNLWRHLGDRDRGIANLLMERRGEGASVLDVLRDVLFYMIDWTKE